MKAPNEIKLALEICAADSCRGCPYEADCDCYNKNKDALAYIQQLERERDAAEKDLEDAFELITKLALILKKYPNAATNGCAYEAYTEIKRFADGLRGVQEVE